MLSVLLEQPLELVSQVKVVFAFLKKRKNKKRRLSYFNGTFAFFLHPFRDFVVPGVDFRRFSMLRVDLIAIKIWG